MKHYLDLIKISEKQRRRQNRMTRLCIVLAVFLVTVLFGMADMEMRSQMIQAVRTDGSWHAAFVMDEEQEALLRARPEVETVAGYRSLNYRLEDGYRIEGIETGICGFDESFQRMHPDAGIVEGVFPKTADEAVINENIKNRLGAEIGDTIRLTMPHGEARLFEVTGIAENTSLTAELDAFCLFLSLDGFSALRPEAAGVSRETLCFVQFRRFCHIQRAIREISEQFELPPDQVRQNVKVLMLMFQSKDTYLMQFYLVAAVLAVLVVIAGILMITASMNSSVARRTEFFGMLRCLGASKGQVIRFVRREALGWCKEAIPAGVAAGTVLIWGLCKMLRLLSPGMFEGLPVLGVSLPGIASGIFVGLITVLMAAGSPAKRASGVSPLTAVSGNAGTVQAVKRTANTKFFRVDTALGVHHASGSRKNFFLVTGSFAFSIILFLAFGTAVDFMHHAITSLRPSAPDLYICKENFPNQIPSGLAGELKEYPGVKRVFGRGYAEFTLPEDGRTLILLSYDVQQFQWAEDALTEGSLQEAADGKGIVSVFRAESALPAGSRVKLSAGGKEQEVTVTGVLGDVPYSYGLDADTGRLTDMAICSEALFQKLTKETGYAVLDVQLRRDATDEQVQEIRRAMEQECGTDVIFSDRRISNREARGASFSMSVFLYGFLAVIALIGFFNMINSIAMSVSARIKEYGVMRAIGMSVPQLIRMVISEAVTYAAFGLLFGCAAGLVLNRFLFRVLVTSRWGEPWSLPAGELLVITAVMSASVCLAVAGPAKQLGNMTAMDTIRRDV